MDEDRKSIIERIAELEAKQTEKEKKKQSKFKIPFKGKVGRGKAKKGWITVMKINDNRQVSFKKLKIDEQTVVEDEIPRIATPEEILIYKNKPMIILPSWSTKPFSPTENYDETLKGQYATQGHKLILNRMESEAIKPKRSFSGAVIFFIIIAIVIGGYLLIKRGGAG